MSEKVKFYNMTKPLKFRAVRRAFKNFSYTLSNVAEGIKSLIYNILYKLNIIEKYSFNDLMVQDIPFSVKPQHFTSGFLSADIFFKTSHREYVDEEWYHKKGNRLKKLYVLKDTHIHRFIFTAHLENIGIKFPGSDKFYLVQRGLPTLHINVSPVKPEPFSGELKRPKYEVVDINIRELESLRLEKEHTCTEHLDTDLKQGMLDSFISTMRTEMTFEFINYFRDKKLSDYFIGGKKYE